MNRRSPMRSRPLHAGGAPANRNRWKGGASKAYTNCRGGLNGFATGRWRKVSFHRVGLASCFQQPLDKIEQGLRGPAGTDADHRE